MRPRNHLITGLVFVGVCVLIGVVLFIVSRVPSKTETAQSSAAAPVVSNAVESEAATPAGTADVSDDSEGWTPSDYDDADSALNEVYQSLMTDLPPADRAALRVTQRQWLATRNSQCGVDSHNSCAMQMTAAKAIELDHQWVARFMPREGQCYSTTVKQVTTRLEDDADQTSGAAISYEDGHGQVDYDSSPGKLGFNVGDPVNLCVVSLPSNCPPGDHRGITYKALDLATQRSWTAADSEHECGGA